MKNITKYLILIAAFMMTNVKVQAQSVMEKALNGDAEAMNTLGIMYDHAWGGLDYDENEAYEWFKKSALAGNIDGIGNIRLRYLYGSKNIKPNQYIADLFNLAKIALIDGDKYQAINIVHFALSEIDKRKEKLNENPSVKLVDNTFNVVSSENLTNSIKKGSTCFIELNVKNVGNVPAYDNMVKITMLSNEIRYREMLIHELTPGKVEHFVMQMYIPDTLSSDVIEFEVSIEKNGIAVVEPYKKSVEFLKVEE